MEWNPSTADRWRKACFRLYELEFRDFHLPLLYAPTEVVRMCMQRFSDSTSGKAMEAEIPTVYGGYQKPVQDDNLSMVRVIRGR
jgi:hypothetical protein